MDNQADGGAAVHMSLRDYFAAQALTALIPTALERKTEQADVAETAYNLADAMLEARKAVPK